MGKVIRLARTSSCWQHVSQGTMGLMKAVLSIRTRPRHHYWSDKSEIKRKETDASGDVAHNLGRRAETTRKHFTLTDRKKLRKIQIEEDDVDQVTARRKSESEVNLISAVASGRLTGAFCSSSYGSPAVWFVNVYHSSSDLERLVVMLPEFKKQAVFVPPSSKSALCLCVPQCNLRFWFHHIPAL